MPLSAGAEVLSPGPETDAVADARSKADHQLRYNTAAARHRQRRVGTLLGLWTDGLTVASCMESPLPAATSWGMVGIRVYVRSDINTYPDHSPCSSVMSSI